MDLKNTREGLNRSLGRRRISDFRWKTHVAVSLYRHYGSTSRGRSKYPIYFWVDPGVIENPHVRFDHIVAGYKPEDVTIVSIVGHDLNEAKKESLLNALEQKRRQRISERDKKDAP